MKQAKRPISLVLTLALLLSFAAFPVSAEETVTLQDAGFEDSSFSAWTTSFISDAPSSYDSWYATDSTHGGSGAYKYWMASAAEYTVTQTLASVPAGTYTLSGYATAAGSSTVSAYFGGLTATDGYSASGQTWGNWGQFSSTFTVEEDMTNVAVGFHIDSPAGGWGRVDDLTLTYVAAEDEPETPVEVAVELTDSNFEDSSFSAWKTSFISDAPSSYDSWYTTDSTHGGSGAYKYWMASAAEYTVTQTLASVPAGTYTLSGYATAASGSTVSAYFGGLTATESTTASGQTWGNWGLFSATFTVEEDMTNVAVGFHIDCPADGWGRVDDLTLTYIPLSSSDDEEEDPSDMDEIILSNGDFELGNTNNWVLTGYSSVATDSYATNNTTYTLNLWLSDDAEEYGAASYTVALTAGTYYFTFDLSGQEADSGLSYTVTAGDTELVKGDSTYTTGGWDVWQTESTAEFTLTEETKVTFTLSGTQPAAYWGNLDNLKLYGTGDLAEVDPDPVEAEIYVPYVKGTADDFMRGMDISSLLSILNSGATFKDYDGNTLDGQGFMNLLAATGTNWVRIRVWNDPFDTSGNGYGGGNCDIEAAKIMGQWATNAGMKVLIDFHYSDFWADPGKQQAPKAWANMTVSEKETAIYDYTKASLTTLKNAGVNVGMVQIGNETTSKFCGESNWANICTLFNAGSKAVREVLPNALVAIHFTNPENGNYASYANTLNTNGVDYDVFASSYYPYWHGTLANLTTQLKAVADTCGKKVIVAETSWAYTLKDGDGWDNTVSASSGYDDIGYDFSVQGQALEISSVAQAVKNVGEAGIGVFYWEPAWIPVQVYDGTVETLNENKALWEQYGSGWASSYAGSYSSDAATWYGGSAVDNQALFAFDGTPLESLKTYLYMQTGTTGYTITVSSVEKPALTYTVGDTLELPETLTVSFSVGDSEVQSVTWDAEDVAAVDMSKVGTYTVTGLVGGEYETTATIIVKNVNLLVNPGMEESDMSMYTISQTYAKRATDDPYSGSYSLHFYNSGVVSFTAEQTVTLTPGHYEFSLFGQGGDVGDDAATYAYVTIGDNTYTADFALTGWASWVNPTICFDLTEETSVTVGISVTAGQGAWGTFDDWYLCVDADAEHTPAEDDGDCTTAIKCTACGTVTTDAKEAHTPAEDDGDCTTAIKCTACGTVTTDAKEAHTPAEDDGDCTTAIKCTACGTVTTEAKEAHTPAEDDGDCTTAIKCTVCGTVTTDAKEAHTPAEDDGDCTTAITCTACDTVITEAKEAHTPAEDDGDCTTAIKCTACGTVTTEAKEAHTPAEDDGDCTTAIKCTACGTVTTEAKEAHTPAEEDGDCTTAIKCTVCGTVTTDAKEAHTPAEDDGDCTTAITCTACDTVITDAKEAHTPAEDDGDCTTAIKCTACGTVTTDAKEAHTPAEDDGDCTTAIKCTACGTVTTDAKEAHTPAEDDGDCTTAIKCTACGTVTTEAKEAHTPAEDDGDCTTAITCTACGTVTTEAKEAHTPAEEDGDCTTAIKCTACGTVTTEAKEAHTPAEDDGDCTTAIKCTACGTVTTEAKEAHSGGNATCEDQPICEICAQPYGTTNSANHAGGTEIKGAVKAEEFKDGYTGDTHCLGCGEKLESGEVIPATHIHAYDKADCTHAATCACGETTGEKDTDNHVGGTEIKGAVKAEEFKDGYTGDTHCLGCGEKLESGTVIPKLKSEEPEETKPEETEPEETVPEETVPEETVPEETVPEETEPEETEPEETEPEETVPEETVPDETKPEETVPDETKPEDTNDKNPDTGDLMWIYVVMLMISAVIIPTFKRRR